MIIRFNKVQWLTIYRAFTHTDWVSMNPHNNPVKEV